MGYQGRIAMAAHLDSGAEHLREAGVDLVFLPFRDAADQAVELLMGEHQRKDIEIIEPEEQKPLAG